MSTRLDTAPAFDSRAPTAPFKITHTNEPTGTTTMNDQELLNQLFALEYSQAELARLLGVSREAVRQAANDPNRRFFWDRPDRLFLLKEAFNRRNNVRALYRVNEYIQAHFPDFLRTERHLGEYVGDQWRRLDLIAPRMEDFHALLTALGWGWPFDGQERELHLLLGLLGGTPLSTAMLARQTAAECQNHMPRHYRLRVAQGPIPPATPPLVRVDENNLYQLGDEGFLPVPERQRQAWASVLEQNNLRWSEPCFIEGGVSGSRVAQASDGGRHGLTFEARPGVHIELSLEQIHGLGWWLRLQGDAPAGGQIRLFDGGGRLWVDAPTEALPWEGRWPYDDAEPAPYLEELQLQLLEPHHDHRAQA